jgi:hypothetical protein
MRFDERPREAVALLNPAFVALLLAHAARQYQEQVDAPMAWPLAFLVLPLVLHEPTRRRLPRAVSTSLLTWVQREPVLRAGLPQRAQALTPTVREGLRFGVRLGALRFEGPALLAARVPGSPPAEATAELRDCVARARLVGRWFATLGDPATIMLVLGVSP